MIYFDNAATSKYKPQCMLDAMVDALENSSNPGRSAHNDAIDMASRIYETRDAIRRILSIDDTYDVIFTKNTTEALNIAILGYIRGFRQRVHVITTMIEHNSVLRPLKYLSKKGAIDVTILPIKDNTIDIADIEMNIRNNTRLIIMNHTSNVTGISLDIDAAAEIARNYNIPILVDGAQSLGHTKINMVNTPITMLAAAGHKGLHGPSGTGFLIAKHGTPLYPLTYGGTGTNSNILDMDIEYPESFEVGTINTAGIIGLGKSVEWTYNNFDTINSHINKLSRLLYTYLESKKNITLYSGEDSSVLSFNVGDYSSEEVATYLNDKNIAVRSGLQCAPLLHSYYNTLDRGMVRVSIGYNNSLSDIDAIISALDNI